MLLCIVLRVAVGFILVSASPRDPAPAPSGYGQAGPHEVRTLLVDWKDARRDRPVSAKIYYPAEAPVAEAPVARDGAKQDEDKQDGDEQPEDKGPFPIVIFSHGLGGSREGYSYLGKHWASHGYVCVHVEHEGSDADVWRGQAKVAEQMQKAAKDPANSINRPKDVAFAIDQLKRMQGEEGPLKGRLALDRIAVAGHSFGAFTALAVAGEAGTHVSEGESLADARVRAAIPMSAPVPFRRPSYEKVYGPIAIPCLHMTGTQDESPIAFTKSEDRRIPYDNINKADQYLVTFMGGDHTIFSGRPRRGPAAEKDKVFQELIRASTTAFVDAYLKGDDEAKAWLQAEGLKTALGKNAKLEQKRPTTRPAEDPVPSKESINVRGTRESRPPDAGRSRR